MLVHAFSQTAEALQPADTTDVDDDNDHHYPVAFGPLTAIDMQANVFIIMIVITHFSTCARCV